MFIDAKCEIPKHIIMDALQALEFVDDLGRGVQIHHDVVTLPVLFDPVGEVAQTPELSLDDLATAGFDNPGEILDKLIDLGAGDILARNKDVFVEWHFMRLPLAVC